MHNYKYRKIFAKLEITLLCGLPSKVMNPYNRLINY